MGLFGKKKSKDAGDNYTDVETANENLPVAIAVFPDAEPMPSQAVPVPSAGQTNGNALITLPAAPPLGSEKQKQHTTTRDGVALVQQQHLILSREPTSLSPCMHCGRNARTRVTTSPNWITWILVGVLLFLFWPLFWLPVSE